MMAMNDHTLNMQQKMHHGFTGDCDIIYKISSPGYSFGCIYTDSIDSLSFLGRYTSRMCQDSHESHQIGVHIPPRPRCLLQHGLVAAELIF
jgi:hypothetical protein